jgi:hypothetical protein
MDLNDYGQHVFSKKIHENMWVVKNEAYKAKFLKEGVVDPIFTWDEVELLKGKGITPEVMKKIWLVRKIFLESEIEEISISPQQKGV